MPIFENSTYPAPIWLPGGHLQTVYPALFRRVIPVTSRRQRLELEDGDFLDLEWHSSGNPRLAILSHGLEADSRSEYIQGMASALVRRGWDVLAWNFRGCGGETNRLLRMYHSGSTADLEAVIRHAIDQHPATAIDLIGFSLGGNLTLKYLGERPSGLPNRLHRAVAFSVPCDLACSSKQLARPSNRIYMERFLRKMRAKIQEKNRLFPNQLDLSGLDRMRTFAEFDGRFTAPIHGFLDADDYWKQNSCRQFLPSIPIPTLLVNALNDPFLGPACHPFPEAADSRTFFFEAPAQGGHVGFPISPGLSTSWAETRALEFLTMPACHLSHGL
jgi:predicted alpha/beta-fold hydrolase